MQIKEFTDPIIATFRRTTPIRFVSRRHVYNIALGYIKTLLNQQRSEYGLLNNQDVITNIDCMEMERVDPSTCKIPEFKRCGILMKSKCKLQGLLNNKNGPSITLVSNVDYSEFYDKTTPKKYLNESSRYGFQANRNVYYYIKDEYLYIVGRHVELITASMVTLKPQLVISECGCDQNLCKPHYEYKMVITDKILSSVTEATKNELGIISGIPSGKSEKE